MADDPQLSDDLVLRAAPGVCTAFLDDEAVLYLVPQAHSALLNPTAAAVWAAIDGETSVAGIVGVLAETFHTRPAAVRADVDRVLRHLLELGALTR